MHNTTSEALRAYFKRVSGASPELFNMAHAICGNYDLAEYALRSALLSVWQENPQSNLGLHEKLRNHVKRIAVKLALSEQGQKCERTWNGLKTAGSDPILNQAAQESVEIRRCLVMRYSCELPVNRIAKIAGIPSGQLKNIFDRFETRSRRRLPSKDRRRFDALLGDAMESVLCAGGADVPSASALYRAFEAEAAELPVNSHRFARIIGKVLFIIMALLCALVFWLYAVLSQPAVLENPSNDMHIQEAAEIPNISN